MEQKLTLRKTFRLKAPVAKVWDALTKPELIKVYFYGTDTETDWKKGSPIYFRGSWEGVDYVDKGTILDIKPQELIRYNYWSSMSGTEDIPENYAIITYELTPVADGTILTVTQDGILSKEKLEHSETNWTQVIEGLRKLVEGNQ